MNSRPLQILCLTSNDPGEPDSGGIVRARNIFQILGRLGEVRLVLASDYQNDALTPGSQHAGFKLAEAVRFPPAQRWSFTERLRNELDPRFMNTHQVQARPEERERLLKLLAGADLVWVHNVKLANMYGLWRWPRSILDIDDIPSGYYRTLLARADNRKDKLRWWRQVKIWQRRERRLLERFDTLSVCSEPDQQALAQTLGDSRRIHILPNAFPMPAQLPTRQPATPARIGFIGDLRFPPNAEGMRWFIDQVWPLILKLAPQTRLRVAGREGEKQPWLQVPNVDCLGWVKDIEPEMATWSLTIVPIFTGGGTRIKTLEAFSRQCPVVSTTLGVFGYDVVDGQDVQLADQPEAFAAKCLEVLAHPRLGESLAGAAWEKFKTRWTWDAQADRVLAVAQTVLSSQP